MSNLIKDVKSKQKEIQELQKEAERKSGRKEQLLKRLKGDFQVSDLEEAKNLLQEFKVAKNENMEKIEELDKKLQEILSSARSSTRAID